MRWFGPCSLCNCGYHYLAPNKYPLGETDFSTPDNRTQYSMTTVRGNWSRIDNPYNSFSTTSADALMVGNHSFAGPFRGIRASCLVSANSWPRLYLGYRDEEHYLCYEVRPKLTRLFLRDGGSEQLLDEHSYPTALNPIQRLSFHFYVSGLVIATTSADLGNWYGFYWVDNAPGGLAAVVDPASLGFQWGIGSSPDGPGAIMHQQEITGINAPCSLSGTVYSGGYWCTTPYYFAPFVDVGLPQGLQCTGHASWRNCVSTVDLVRLRPVRHPLIEYEGLSTFYGNYTYWADPPIQVAEYFQSGVGWRPVFLKWVIVEYPATGFISCSSAQRALGCYGNAYFYIPHQTDPNGIFREWVYTFRGSLGCHTPNLPFGAWDCTNADPNVLAFNGMGVGSPPAGYPAISSMSLTPIHGNYDS